MKSMSATSRFDDQQANLGHVSNKLSRNQHLGFHDNRIIKFPKTKIFLITFIKYNFCLFVMHYHFLILI